MTNQIIKDTAEYNYKLGQSDKEKEVLELIDECSDHRGIINADELKSRLDKN